MSALKINFMNGTISVSSETFSVDQYDELAKRASAEAVKTLNAHAARPSEYEKSARQLLEEAVDTVAEAKKHSRFFRANELALKDPSEDKLAGLTPAEIAKVRSKYRLNYFSLMDVPADYLVEEIIIYLKRSLEVEIEERRPIVITPLWSTTR